MQDAGQGPRIDTRATRLFGIAHPVLGAPMAGAAGGRLAAAITRAGGFGLIGGGYGDPDWLAREFAAAKGARVGCGLLVWRIEQEPAMLTRVLAQRPAAMLLSFGDPRPWAGQVADAGIPLIVMAQTRDDAARAVEAGAVAVIAQGAEAGGHSGSRATITLVPEIADFLTGQAPEVVPLAAGGIGDGRGLAAALMLGAEGAMIGSRFWTSAEALVSEGYQQAAVAASGDATMRTWMVGPMRGYTWPEEYRCRVLASRFTERWHDDPEGLLADTTARAALREAEARGDAANGLPVVGEAVGVIHDRAEAGVLLRRMVADAAKLLARAPGRLGDIHRTAS